VGYDMAWVRQPDPIDLLQRLASGGVRGELLAERLSRELSLLKEASFQLNVTGMTLWRQEMEAQGIGHWEGDFDFPDPADFGSLWAEDNEQGDGYRQWESAHDAVLCHKVGGTRGIALKKFCSNDGWIVTPEEIGEALAVASEVPLLLEPQDVPLWRKWLRFLRGGQGGDQGLLTRRSSGPQIGPNSPGNPRQVARFPGLNGEQVNRQRGASKTLAPDKEVLGCEELVTVWEIAATPAPLPLIERRTAPAHRVQLMVCRRSELSPVVAAGLWP
jgi:hypothetical protein